MRAQGVLVLDFSGNGGAFTSLPNTPESRRVNYQVLLGETEAAFGLPAYFRAWLTDDELAQLQSADTFADDYDRLPIRLRLLYSIVSSAVEEDKGLSSRDIRKLVAGRNPDVDAARDELISEGVIERQPGRNGGFTFWPAGFQCSDGTEPAEAHKRPIEPEPEAIDISEFDWLRCRPV